MHLEDVIEIVKINKQLLPDDFESPTFNDILKQ